MKVLIAKDVRLSKLKAQRRARDERADLKTRVFTVITIESGQQEDE
jgi:hypothetical protein